MAFMSDMAKIPRKPGCYIFRNKRREIIYIGKSKSLRNRVRQYFYENDSQKGKYIDLVREIHEIETIVTATETNALILECQLIKEYQPQYNSQLKRSKVFPFIKIDLKQAYPPILITNSVEKDGCEYYGCFYSQDDALSTLETLGSIWQTPICRKDHFTGRHKPCLHHHLEKCCAPCGGGITSEMYRQKIIEIVKCLNGNNRHVASRLKKEMEMAAADFQFERAAHLRNDLLSLANLKKKLKRLYTNLDHKDVYLFFRAFNEKCFSLFFIRNGVTLNRMDFPNLRTLAAEKLAVFVHDNKQGKEQIGNGSFLTSCLLEIGACKRFVPVSQKMSNLRILEKLGKAFTEFIE